MHTPPFLQGGLSLQPNFKKEMVVGKEGVCDFFQEGVGGGGCNFHVKNKLKSEIFNDKKSL